MEDKKEYEKILKCLNMSKVELDNFISSSKPLESINTKQEDDYAIFPLEPNFQLPNVFLKTKKNYACQRFLDENSVKRDFSFMEEIIDFLDDLDFYESGNDEEKVDMKILEELVNRRYK